MDELQTKFIDTTGVEMAFHTKKGVFQAMQGIDLAASEREFITLIDHSGCSKSTLLNLVARLLKPTTGLLICAGREIDAPSL